MSFIITLLVSFSLSNIVAQTAYDVNVETYLNQQMEKRDEQKLKEIVLDENQNISTRVSSLNKINNINIIKVIAENYILEYKRYYDKKDWANEIFDFAGDWAQEYYGRLEKWFTGDKDKKAKSIEQDLDASEYFAELPDNLKIMYVIEKRLFESRKTAIQNNNPELTQGFSILIAEIFGGTAGNELEESSSYGLKYYDKELLKECNASEINFQTMCLLMGTSEFNKGIIVSDYILYELSKDFNYLFQYQTDESEEYIVAKTKNNDEVLKYLLKNSQYIQEKNSQTGRVSNLEQNSELFNNFYTVPLELNNITYSETRYIAPNSLQQVKMTKATDILKMLTSHKLTKDELHQHAEYQENNMSYFLDEPIYFMLKKFFIPDAVIDNSYRLAYYSSAKEMQHIFSKEDGFVGMDYEQLYIELNYIMRKITSLDAIIYTHYADKNNSAFMLYELAMIETIIEFNSALGVLEQKYMDDLNSNMLRVGDLESPNANPLEPIEKSLRILKVYQEISEKYADPNKLNGIAMDLDTMSFNRVPQKILQQEMTFAKEMEYAADLYLYLKEKHYYPNTKEPTTKEIKALLSSIEQARKGYIEF